MQFLSQTGLLALSFISVFIWQQTPASEYTIQALAVLIVFYILLTFTRKKGLNPLTNVEGSGLWSIFILNSIIFLFIFATGALNSPLFFLLYFLAFGVSFVYNPATVFVFAIGTVLLFLPTALEGDTMGNLIRVGSLGIIAPLAYFFGREFRQEEKQEDKINSYTEATKDSADKIAKDVHEVLEDGKEKMESKDVEKLNDILEETEVLREESKD